MNANMPNIPLTYYQNEEGQYVCLNELPDDDIRKYLSDLSGTVDIKLNSGSTTQVNYELIEQNPNDNNISTFNNVYS
jgi:restriction endonuclease S subunit